MSFPYVALYPGALNGYARLQRWIHNNSWDGGTGGKPLYNTLPSGKSVDPLGPLRPQPITSYSYTKFSKTKLRKNVPYSHIFSRFFLMWQRQIPSALYD